MLKVPGNNGIHLRPRVKWIWEGDRQWEGAGCSFDGHFEYAPEWYRPTRVTGINISAVPAQLKFVVKCISWGASNMRMKLWHAYQPFTLHSLAIHYLLAVELEKCQNFALDFTKHCLMLLFPEIGVATKRHRVTTTTIRDVVDLIILHRLTDWHGSGNEALTWSHAWTSRGKGKPFGLAKKWRSMEIPFHSLFSFPFHIEKPVTKTTIRFTTKLCVIYGCFQEIRDVNFDKYGGVCL